MRKPLNLDSDLEEFLAAEDRLELKRQRAVDEQMGRDRKSIEFSQRDLLWIVPLGAIVAAAVLYFIAWLKVL